MLRLGIPQTARYRASGFTLLELLVVVAILGLLVGYVAPRYFGQIGKSEVTTARAQIDALDKALDQYRLDTGRYPTTELGLNALSSARRTSPSGTAPISRKTCRSIPGASRICTRLRASAATTISFPTARTASPAAPRKMRTLRIIKPGDHQSAANSV